MESGEIKRIFYRDGYRLAHEHLDQGITAADLSKAIAEVYQAVDDLLESFIQRSNAEGSPLSAGRDAPGAATRKYLL